MTPLLTTCRSIPSARARRANSDGMVWSSRWPSPKVVEPPYIHTSSRGQRHGGGLQVERSPFSTLIVGDAMSRWRRYRTGSTPFPRYQLAILTCSGHHFASATAAGTGAASAGCAGVGTLGAEMATATTSSAPSGIANRCLTRANQGSRSVQWRPSQSRCGRPVVRRTAMVPAGESGAANGSTTSTRWRHHGSSVVIIQSGASSSVARPFSTWWATQAETRANRSPSHR